MGCTYGYACTCLVRGSHCRHWRDDATPSIAIYPTPEQVRATEEAERQRVWDVRFLDLALYITGEWSKDPSTQVGAVVVNAKRSIIGTGYNGFPRGVSDLPCRYEDRKEKYPRIVHAEMNALITASPSGEVDGSTLYCTHPLCCDCAKHAIQFGVKRIVARAVDLERWGESLAFARSMLGEAGVQFDLLTTDP